MVEKKIISFGVDIDLKGKCFNDNIVKRIRRLKKEKVVSSFKITPSRNGFHYHCRLWKAITFERSMELRFLVGDDALRWQLDVLRHWAGSRPNDILFTKKWKGW